MVVTMENPDVVSQRYGQATSVKLLRALRVLLS